MVLLPLENTNVKQLHLAAAPVALALASSLQAAAPIYAGTWNVTSTVSEDVTCEKIHPGDVAAYIWIVSQTADGALTVTVQGDKNNEKLEGKWNADKQVLVLTSESKGPFGRGGVWLKLTPNKSGELTGIRRYVSGSCFVDSTVVAKKQ